MQGKILSIFAADAPHGRQRNSEEGFTQRFLSSRRGFWSYTPFFRYTHRKWGSIGSRGATADRDLRWRARHQTPIMATPTVDHVNDIEASYEGQPGPLPPVEVPTRLTIKAIMEPQMNVLFTTGMNVLKSLDVAILATF